MRVKQPKDEGAILLLRRRYKKMHKKVYPISITDNPGENTNNLS